MTVPATIPATRPAIAIAGFKDVYHVPWERTVLYIKFTIDAEGHVLISLKEK